MTVNLQLLAQQPLLICGLVVLLMGIKALVLYPIARLFGMCDKKAGLRLAVVLSQGGEFAFVLFGLVGRQNILDPTLIDKLILVVAVSMMLTPIIYSLVEKFSNRYDDNAEPEFDEMVDEHPAVIIAGFGRFGQIVARLLRIADRPFTALELDSSQVDVVRKYGTKIYYGDASKTDILRAAGAAEAKIFVLAIDDIESSVRTAETVSRHFPNLQIIARARNRRHEYKLMDLGIEHIYRETFLSSVALGENVLIELGMSPPEVQMIAELFTDRDRKLMIEQHAVQHDEERLIQSAKETAAELDTLLQRDLQE